MQREAVEQDWQESDSLQVEPEASQEEDDGFDDEPHSGIQKISLHGHKGAAEKITPKFLSAETKRWVKRVWLLAVFTATLVTVVYHATHSPLLAVTDIEIKGVNHMDEAGLVRWMQTGRDSLVGANIFSVSTGLLENRIAQHPWVKSVRVERTLPNTLKVDIQEHIPVAYVHRLSLSSSDLPSSGPQEQRPEGHKLHGAEPYGSEQGGEVSLLSQDGVLFYKQRQMDGGLDVPWVMDMSEGTVASKVAIPVSQLLQELEPVLSRLGTQVHEIFVQQTGHVELHLMPRSGLPIAVSVGPLHQLSRERSALLARRISETLHWAENNQVMLEAIRLEGIHNTRKVVVTKRGESQPG